MILESLGDRQDGGLFIYSKKSNPVSRESLRGNTIIHNLLISVWETVLQPVKDDCWSCGEESEWKAKINYVARSIGYDKKISRDAVKVAIDWVIPFLLLILQKFMNF